MNARVSLSFQESVYWKAPQEKGRAASVSLLSFVGGSRAELLDDAASQLFADQSVDDRVDGWWNYDEKDAAEFLNVGRQRGEATTDDNDQRGHLVDHINHQVCGTRAEGFGVDACPTVSDAGVQDSEVGKGDDREDACTQHPGHRQAYKTRPHDPFNPELLKMAELPDPFHPRLSTVR